MRSRAWGYAGLTLAIVLAADQLAKRIVQHDIAIGDERSVFFGIHIVHSQNNGVAFNAFAGSGVLVAVVIGVAVAGLLVYFATHATRPLVWLPTGLCAGGALGNIFDRVRDGAVTDFIKLPFWPAFNLADVAITAGVLALLLVLERDHSKPSPGAADGGM